MKISKRNIFGIIGIVLLVVFACGCTSSNNNNTTTSNGQSSQSGQPASSTGSPLIKIISSVQWSGNIQTNSGSRSVQGSGTESLPLSQNPGTVTVTIQKSNANDVVSNGTIIPNTSTLTVEIIDSNGNIVATQSTSADAGVASTTHTF
jgi:hypothetical protein